MEPSERPFGRLRRLELAALAIVLSAACVSDGVDNEALALIDGQPDAVGVLAFLNAETTTFALLDQGVRLDRRAAEGIIAHRDGPDGVHGTRDDRPFARVDEILAVRWVGPAMVQRILDYTRANGLIPEGDDLLGVYEGVAFTVDEAEATLRVANTAAEATLRHDAGLPTQAVRGILEARPIRSVLALSEVRYVGPVSVERLRAYALSVPPPVACASDADCDDDARCDDAGRAGDDDSGICRHDDELLGVFDGVSFTLGEADASLALVNLAAAAILQGDVGLTARAVDNVVEARPIDTIPALAAVPWVGPASLERVRNFARDNPALIASLVAPAPPEGCVSDAVCEEGTVCAGTRAWGPDRTGECTDPSELRPEGSDCTLTRHCAPGSFCAGLSWGDPWGTCNPDWMQTTLEFDGFAVAGGETVLIEFTVAGLASVPYDTAVTFRDVGATAPVVVTLENLYETSSRVWNPSLPRPLEGEHIVFAPGDEAINGPWRLRVQNTGTANVEFGRWSLYFASRWD